jgi:DNA-binding MarR family transcriptional regulator
VPGKGEARLRLERFLPYRLSVTSNAVSSRIAAIYRARFGLSISEWRMIAVIAERGEPVQAELVAATAMDKMTVSRAVSALVARGLLRRDTSPADRRTAHLSLTAEGQRLYEEVAPLALAIEAELLAPLGEAERRKLFEMLAMLEKAACRES